MKVAHAEKMMIEAARLRIVTLSLCTVCRECSVLALFLLLPVQFLPQGDLGVQSGGSHF
jgi:hypothetical protein